MHIEGEGSRTFNSLGHFFTNPNALTLCLSATACYLYLDLKKSPNQIVFTHL